MAGSRDVMVEEGATTCTVVAPAPTWSMQRGNEAMVATWKFRYHIPR